MHASTSPPDAPGSHAGSTYTRAIPPAAEYAQGIRAKLSQSPHVTEPVSTIRLVLADVFPIRGGSGGSMWRWLAMSAAGLFRLGVYSLTWLAEQAVRTRVGAGVGLAVFVTCCLISAIAHVLS
jgi:hypothetical protein